VGRIERKEKRKNLEKREARDCKLEGRVKPYLVIVKR